MKVSIITACYNDTETIEQCMDSVANQDYPDIEHVIIDGGSKDGSLNIIEKKKKKYTRLYSKPDEGLYHALNKGIERSTGDVIGFLHADDFFADSQVINDLIYCLIKHNTDGIYGDLQYVKRNNIHHITRHWKSGYYNKKILREGWMPPHTALFLKREVYDKYGLYDSQYKISSDYDFILRILYNQSTSLMYLPKLFVKMRTGGISNRNIRNIIIKSLEDLRALQNNHLKYPLLILLNKNLSKIKQFYPSLKTSVN